MGIIIPSNELKRQGFTEDIETTSFILPDRGLLKEAEFHKPMLLNFANYLKEEGRRQRRTTNNTSVWLKTT